jgi:hypothetical protein
LQSAAPARSRVLLALAPDISSPYCTAARCSEIGTKRRLSPRNTRTEVNRVAARGLSFFWLPPPKRQLEGPAFLFIPAALR